MRRMVVVAIIAVLVLFALVEVVASKDKNIWIDRAGTYVSPGEGYTDTEFYYYVTLDSDLGEKKSVDCRLNIYYHPDESLPPITKVCSSKGKCEFGPINFLDYSKENEETEDASYTFEVRWNGVLMDRMSSEKGLPIVKIPPPPDITLFCPVNVYYSGNLKIEAIIEDVIGETGVAMLRAYMPPGYTTSQFIRLPKYSVDAKKIGKHLYSYTWVLDQRDHRHIESDKNKEFKVELEYKNSRYGNTTIGWYNVTEYLPEIIGGPYLNNKLLTKGLKSEIDNIRWNDLDEGNFSFNVIIEDEIEKGNAILQVCRRDNNDSSYPKNYSLKSDEKEGDSYKYNYYNNSVRFNRSDAYKNLSLRLYYDRPKLPSTWHHPWERYNLTLIPFEINFTNATVSLRNGSWDDMFNYKIEINSTKYLSIALKIFDPCLETWPSPGDRTYNKTYNRNGNKSGWKQLNWTVKGDTYFSENCSGKSKFYFEYEGKETEVYPGPDLGDIVSDGPDGPDGHKKPPEFNTGITNPNVAIYCNWSQTSTPCNYSVNVNSEYDYRVRLFVRDPTGEWMPKGDIKDIFRRTKNITWTIAPFVSLNINDIAQYIGKHANFSFEYDGESDKDEFRGPLLVAAFKEPKTVPDPEKISYNDTFNYSVTVIGSEKLLNITLKYLSDGKWTSEDITEPTKEYNNNNNNTERKLLTWTCKAIKLWEDVKFDVNVTGEGKPIEVY